MKRTFILLAIVTMLVSCSKTEDQSTMWKIINLEVKHSDWILNKDGDGLNKYYSCTLDMPEITSFVYNQGTVLGYNVIGDAQQVLPYVRHYQNTSGNFWTRTVDFDYSIGKMTVYVTNSDFFEEVPPTMDFRVVLMW